MIKKLLLASSLLFTGATYAGGGTPTDANNSSDDGVSNAMNSWEYQALGLQYKLDRRSPLQYATTLGTHNSYNSEAHQNGYPRYIDPQQKFTIFDQLRMGARFIELDVHWTLNSSNWRYHLVLCHAQGNHVGCSPNDMFFSEGLSQISSWLELPEAQDQLLTLYIEDYSENVHDQMYDQLNAAFGDRIYKSNGCTGMPRDITKEEIVQSGKNVIIWKDKGCPGHTGLSSFVFNDLAGRTRVWEDATAIAALGGFFTGNGNDRIEESEIRPLAEGGSEIINLDDMDYNDGRNDEIIWSWAQNEPNDYNGNEDCATQRPDRRWNDVNCSNNYRVACRKSDGGWQVTDNAVSYDNASSACSALGMTFDVPNNAPDNVNLRNAANGAGDIYININDRSYEGQWDLSGDEEYRQLKNVHSGKCLDVSQMKNKAAQNVHQWDCHGGDNQRWKYEASTGFLRNKMGMCLDGRGQANNGGEVVIWPCIDNDNLRWDFDGQLIRSRINNNILVEVGGFSQDNGGNVQQWSNANVASQRWVWE